MALLEKAVAAEKNLEQLATGLAQGGVDQKIVDTVTQMAEVTRKIVSALGKGQEGTGDGQPPVQAQDQGQSAQGQAQPDTFASATDAVAKSQQPQA
jgi:hypothetical protein